MKYFILIITLITFTSCFETFEDLEESPFESTSTIQFLEVTGDLTQRYLANEWETFIYIQVDTTYVQNPLQTNLLVYKDGQYLMATNIRESGTAQFYDKATLGSRHCYNFGITKENSGVSKRLTEDYCIDFE